MSERLPESDDFGLAAGEEFEPELPEEPPFDLSRPHIMTVRGPIEPDALGLVLPKEHLIAKIPGIGVDMAEHIDDEYLALAELEDFYVVGGRAIVDTTPADWGRDLGKLRWIAERSPVTIVAASGAGSRVEGAETVDCLAKRWIGELRDGAARSGVRPGVIAVERGAGELSLRAAARAHLATGVPVLTSLPSPIVQRVMDEEGVAPDRVIVAVEADDLGKPAKFGLDAGFWLLIERIGLGPTGVAGLAEQARSTWRLIEAGFAGRLLCSLNCSRRAEWRSGGGEGWGMILERWPLALMEVGAEALTVRQLLVDNPADVLAVRQ